VLARVLHDWEDDPVSLILAHARDALRPGGRIAILEMLRDEETHHGALCGLHLLAVTGGRERTFPEYARLLAGAGFRAEPPEWAPGLCRVIVGRC
jgi:C-methyltransferase